MHTYTVQMYIHVYLLTYIRGGKNTFKMNSEQQYKVSYFSELEVVTKYQIITLNLSSFQLIYHSKLHIYHHDK